MPSLLSLVVLIMAFFSVEFANAGYRAYDWPVGLIPESGQRLMRETLHLHPPHDIMLPGPPPINSLEFTDQILTEHPDFYKNAHELAAFWKVAGSKDEPPIIFLIDGPANIRTKPEGEIIASWPNGKPVLVLKSNKNWRLVIDTDGHYAWTSVKNLKAFSQGKLLLKEDSPIAKGLPKSALDWQKLFDQIMILRTLHSQKKCPSFLSERILDGLEAGVLVSGPDDEITPERLLFEQVSAWNDCPKPKATSSVHPLNSASFPKMKSKSCGCYSYDATSSTSVVKMSPEEWFGLSKYPCEKLQFHYVCEMPTEGSDGIVGEEKACPLNCF